MEKEYRKKKQKNRTLEEIGSMKQNDFNGKRMSQKKQEFSGTHAPKREENSIKNRRIELQEKQAPKIRIISLEQGWQRKIGLYKKISSTRHQGNPEI